MEERSRFLEGLVGLTFPGRLADPYDIRITVRGDDKRSTRVASRRTTAAATLSLSSRIRKFIIVSVARGGRTTNLIP